ncbi:MAG: DUF4139 domain-containing protein [bacterium]
MPNFLRTSLLIVCAPIGLLAAQSSRLTPSADVPVTKIMLFSSGVGYFEHAGLVHGNGSTELRFRTGQINDILKSIILQDEDGGHVGAITYPSQDPLAKTLRSFQVDITQNPSQAQLLNQLRGARVTVQAQGATMTGTVLGVETRRITDKGETMEVAVLNLLTGAMIRAVELPSITSVTIDDPQLQDELNKALATLVQARDQDRKPVTISFLGAGDRRVRIGYVVETPVWKTSYRLLMNEKGTAGALQGWAMVENQTESDWNNVALSLVSGRPMSFTMDLYQPLYVTRPVVVPELYASLHPQLYEGGTQAERERVSMVVTGANAAKAQRRTDERAFAAPLSEMMVSAAPAPTLMDMTSSVQAMASTGRLGELFQYTIGNVTLARQKSAMLPIITDSVELQRVSIFNASVLASNPLSGVWLKNTTGKHVLQGPVTVLDRGGYAGDARIDDVPPGQSRFLSYGIDLDVAVDNTKNTQVASVTGVKIVKGILSVVRRSVASQEYAADNRGARDKVLVVEHPIRQGWSLVDTEKPFETTSSLYRFKGTAAAKKVTTLVVREALVQNESLALLPMDVGQLLLYTRTSEIPRDVRDAIGKAVQMKQDLVDAERQLAAKTQQIGEITAEQARIRENMRTVGQSGSYYERLLAKLNEQESIIEKLQADRSSLASKRDSTRRDLEDYLKGLSVG